MLILILYTIIKPWDFPIPHSTIIMGNRHSDFLTSDFRLVRQMWIQNELRVFKLETQILIIILA